MGGGSEKLIGGEIGPRSEGMSGVGLGDDGARGVASVASVVKRKRYRGEKWCVLFGLGSVVVLVAEGVSSR